MSNLSASPSGYANRHSPAALAAAVALNGGLVTLLIAIPVTFKALPPIERLIAYPISTPTPPPPAPPAPPPASDRKAAVPQPRLAQPRPPVPVEPIMPLGGQPALPTDFTPITPGPVGPIAPTVEPIHEPAVVKATQDPRYAGAFRPDYPPALRREGLEGHVTVRVTIDARGRVIAVAQVSATDPAFFEATRRQALREWRFRPATRDGVPVQSELTLTVQFRLED